MRSLEPALWTSRILSGSLEVGAVVRGQLVAQFVYADLASRQCFEQRRGEIARSKTLDSQRVIRPRQCLAALGGLRGFGRDWHGFGRENHIFIVLDSREEMVNDLGCPST
jgi:hypothetical protein